MELHRRTPRELQLVSPSGSQPLVDPGGDPPEFGSLAHQPRRARYRCIILSVVGIYVAIVPVMYISLHIGAYPGCVRSHTCSVEWTSSFRFDAKDGKTLPGAMLQLPNSSNCEGRMPLLVFGGNPEAMGGAAHQALSLLAPINVLNASYGFQAFFSPYRGYPLNPGWGSERTMVADAEELLDFAINESGHDRIAVVGISMGAAVATHLVARRSEHVAGLLVVSPFSSLHLEVLVFHAPWTYLIWPWIWTVDVWNSLHHIATLPEDLPVAVLSSQADEIIPPEQHQALFDACSSRVKWWLPIAGARHARCGQMAQAASYDLASWVDHMWERISAGQPIPKSVPNDGGPCHFAGPHGGDCKSMWIWQF